MTQRNLHYFPSNQLESLVELSFNGTIDTIVKAVISVHDGESVDILREAHKSEAEQDEISAEVMSRTVDVTTHL